MSTNFTGRGGREGEVGRFYNIYSKNISQFLFGEQIERAFCLPRIYLEPLPSSPTLPTTSFVFCFLLFFSKYAYPTCVQNSERFPWKHNIERPYVQTAHNFKQSRLIGKKEKKSCFFFLFAFDFFQKDKMKGTVIHILSPVNSQWGFRIKR